LVPPTFEDPDLTERGRILYVMMLITAGIVVVAGGFALARMSPRDVYAGLPAVVGYLAMQLLGMWGIRRGRVTVVAWIYCGLLWASLAGTQFMFRQHEVLLTASFINITLVAGFSLGARAAFGFGFLTVGWIGATIWMDEVGFTPTYVWSTKPLDLAITASGPLIVTAILIGYGLTRLNRAIASAREVTRASEARARAGSALGQLGRRVVELIDADHFAQEVLLVVPELAEGAQAAIYRTAGGRLSRWRESDPDTAPASLESALLDGAETGVSQLDSDALGGGGPGTLIEIPGRRVRQGALLVRRPDGRPVDVVDEPALWTCAALLGAAFERAETEAQLRQAQKMEAVGQLAGGVAHDFNNLLTSIIGGASLMLEDAPDDSPNEPLLRDIVRAGEHASLLTTQLLVFSRKEQLNVELVDLREAVRGLEGILGRLLGPRIRLEAPGPGDRITILADRRAIEQIVFNLCLNARDAVEQHGRITLATSAERDGDAGTAMLVVADDGCGMDPPTVERIFEPFFTTKGVGQGTGLGLSTVRGLVDELGGLIEVDTAPGEGAKFTLTFPLAEDVVARSDQPKERAPRAHEGELLLLVEDHDLARRTLRATLENAGYSVVTARDGHEALTSLERLQQVAAIVTDVIMPRMGGDELVMAMRELGHDIPTVMLSGYSGREHGESMAPTGTLSLAKPVTAFDLLTAVRTVIDRDTPASAELDPARARTDA
jgi:signal transduction histidine kinase/ActR/RegA family two-component response regulator